MRSSRERPAISTHVSQGTAMIGYISMGYLNPSTASLKCVPGIITPEGVSVGCYDPATKVEAPGPDTGNRIFGTNMENVKTGSYHLSRDLYFITNSMPGEDANAFIDYVRSPEGMAIVQLNQYIPVGLG